MKHKTLLKRLKETGWNMKFDAREQALIEDIAEITEQELKVNRAENRVALKIAELKEKIEEAFNDMATIYAPELTGDRFKLSRKIRNKGAGVIGYIATKRNEAIKALEELRRQ